MDLLYEQGVHVIHFLQTRLLTNKRTVDVLVSTPQYLADPDTLMIFAFPLLLAFNRWLACRFALTIGVVDMVNTFLKWMLNGERPYWWVHEVSHAHSLPPLEHHPLTCETGAGSPSGHAMSSAAVGFVLVSTIIDQYVRKVKNGSVRKAMEGGLWLVYAVTLAVISLARLRLATHFPHQLVLGAAAGLCGGWIIWNLPIDRIRRKHFFSLAFVLFIAAVLTYAGLLLMGIDPNRTVQLALKHCADTSYVKLSTTPWHSVYRNFALMLAVGFCATTSLWRNVVSKATFGVTEQIPIIFFSLAISQSLASIPYPHQPAYIFYLCAFIKNVAIVVSCLLLVPLAVLSARGSILNEKKAENSRKVTGTAIRQG